MAGDIGRCELCGVVDHHLADGACAECNARIGAPAPIYPEAARAPGTSGRDEWLDIPRHLRRGED